MLRRYRLPIVAGLIVILAVHLFGFRWRAANQVARRHAALIEGIEEKKWGRCNRLIAPTYSDRWGFDRDDLALTLRDVAGQFYIVLDMEWETDSVTREGKTFRIKGHGSFTGKGSPLTSTIEAAANRYRAEPFTFHWEKQSALPWDWKLVRIEHPTIEVPAGYQPGDLGSALSGGF